MAVHKENLKKSCFCRFAFGTLLLPMASKKSPLTSNPDKFFGEGLTFDDVLLMPAYSEVLPREVDIRSQLTKSIKPVNNLVPPPLPPAQ